VPTATANRIYHPAGELSAQTGVVLHTVTSCDLAAAELQCESTAFFGTPGREFYVSPRAVYVWAWRFGGWDDDEQPPAVLYRMPLDGSAPTGLRVSGEPIDQFSFLESPDGHLNVLTRLDTYTLQEAWREQAPPNPVALLRVPLSALTDGSRTAPREMYSILPTPGAGSLRNRYVGDWLLYGAGAGWGAPRPGPHRAYALRWDRNGPVIDMEVPHGIDRIEALGPAALLVGGDGQALHFTSVRLDPGVAYAAGTYARVGASQGETRSHGFFYHADGADAGVLGLPVRGADRPGYEHLRRGSMSILFLRNRGCGWTRRGRWTRARPRTSPTAAAPAAWTGTATRAPSFCAAACWH
jgi:Beta propeller domain